ncbi:MAG: hypothetical protein JXA11_16695 [Phycisphaerae bacterium]|nr:hypothetical protein [Phycisphaerae bacterium]
MSDQNKEEMNIETQYQTMAEFLESNPPNQLVNISDLSYLDKYSRNMLFTPEIQLHCDHEKCNGIRFFRCISGKERDLNDKNFEFIFLTYLCSNCQNIQKTFSLAAKVNQNRKPEGECYKFGELPTYGPPVSPKLIKLIGPDRDEFLQGRTCENQGLGIGAFSYYRRVVEKQKNRIIGEIIKVSENIHAPDDQIKKLRAAIEETQFSNALKMAKDAIPESLLINGHNPLLLLHSALSEGIHALSDEQCLELAESIRIVLGELSERLSQALKDEAELKKALSVVMKKNVSK